MWDILLITIRFEKKYTFRVLQSAYAAENVFASQPTNKLRASVSLKQANKRKTL